MHTYTRWGRAHATRRAQAQDNEAQSAWRLTDLQREREPHERDLVPTKVTQDPCGERIGSRWRGHRQGVTSIRPQASRGRATRSRITECHLKKVTIRCHTCIFRCSKQWETTTSVQQARTRKASSRQVRTYLEAGSRTYLEANSSLMAKRRLTAGSLHVCSLHLSSGERTLVKESDTKQARKIRRRGLPLKTHLVCRALGHRGKAMNLTRHEYDRCAPERDKKHMEAC